MSPSRARVAVVPEADSVMPDIESTAAPFASVPDTAQPNGAVPASESPTSSEKATSIVRRSVTFADRTAGACPSPRVRGSAPAPRALPDASSTPAAPIDREPVAPVPASCPVNESTCEEVVSPDIAETARGAPSTTTEP